MYLVCSRSTLKTSADATLMQFATVAEMMRRGTYRPRLLFYAGEIGAEVSRLSMTFSVSW